MVAHLAQIGRKRSTLQNYDSCLRVHLGPFFGRRPLHRITREQVEAFIALKRGEGLAPKPILNYLSSALDICLRRAPWSRGRQPLQARRQATRRRGGRPDP
jgi:hypothetical protein